MAQCMYVIANTDAQASVQSCTHAFTYAQAIFMLAALQLARQLAPLQLLGPVEAPAQFHCMMRPVDPWASIVPPMQCHLLAPVLPSLGHRVRMPALADR